MRIEARGALAQRLHRRRAILTAAASAASAAAAAGHSRSLYAAPAGASDSADDAGLSESTPASELELALFARVNAERAVHGVAPVLLDGDLIAIARARAAAQASKGPLSHVEATGQPVLARLLLHAGISYRMAGENLVRLTGPESTVVERAQAALMASPTHRATILRPAYDRLAVGAATDESGRVIFAQIFRAAGAEPGG